MHEKQGNPFSVFVIVTLLSPIGLANAGVPIGRFVDVQPIELLEPGVSQDCCPVISADGLSLLFASPGHLPNRGSWDMYEATRAFPDQPFDNVEWINTDVNSGSVDAPSSLSPGGHNLFFYSNRRGYNDIYMATRTGSDGPFGNAVLFPGISDPEANDGTPVVSTNELEFFFNSDRTGGEDLWVARRDSPAVSFGVPMPLDDVNSSAYDTGPTLSSDGLTLLFVSWREPNGELFAATRTDLDSPFGTPVNLNDFSLGSEINELDVSEGSPHISPDWPAAGSKLYFFKAHNPDHLSAFQVADWDLYEATWVPESSPCDLDYDGVCDVGDLDRIYAVGNVSEGVEIPPAFATMDLEKDNVVNRDDVAEWLNLAAAENGFAWSYLDGDANLDGVVDATDLNALALNWRSDNAVWSSGDFTGEGIVDASDLNEIGRNWLQSIPLAAVAPNVPEPSSSVLAFLAFAAVTSLLRRRKAGASRTAITDRLLPFVAVDPTRGEQTIWNKDKVSWLQVQAFFPFVDRYTNRDVASPGRVQSPNTSREHLARW